MYEEFVQPNDITSFCNWFACSEADLVYEGMLYYPSMIITFGLAYLVAESDKLIVAPAGAG
jgi:hypothetical protein